MTVVEGDPKVQFSIATTPRCWEASNIAIYTFSPNTTNECKNKTLKMAVPWVRRK